MELLLVIFYLLSMITFATTSLCPEYDLSQSFTDAQTLTDMNDPSLDRMNHALSHCSFDFEYSFNQRNHCFGHCMLRRMCFAVQLIEDTLLCRFCMGHDTENSTPQSLSDIFVRLEALEDDCSSSPCQNGGTCHDEVYRYTCACPPNLSGVHCEQDMLDECTSNPCQNGGTCHNHIDHYECTCIPGYTDTNCDLDIDECSSYPCQPNGVCRDDVNSYSCDCNAGYEGIHCENDINECSSNPCQGQGHCTDELNYYTCACYPGFEGVNCESNIDECAGNPCLNGATCEDRINGFQCQCTSGTSGQQCESIDMSALHEVICRGGENPDSGVTVRVTSMWYGTYGGHYICLDNTEGCWSVGHANADQWAEVDIGSERLLVQIGTKGDAWAYEWVTRYELYRIAPENTFIGQYSGNVDGHTPVYHELDNPVIVQIIRIVPLEWHDWIGMRVGLFVI